MIEALVVFGIGILVGRWSKTCRISVGQGDAIPSAVGEITQAMAAECRARGVVLDMDYWVALPR